MSDVLLPVVVIGGTVYTLSKLPSSGTVTNGGQTCYVAPIGGSTMNDVTRSAGCNGGGYTYNGCLDDSQYGAASFRAQGGTSCDPQQQQKIDMLNTAMESRYNNMDSVARALAAKELNDQLGTKLTGNETWQQVGAIVGGVAGTAACSYVGLEAFAGALCAMAGSYLGVKLEDWISTGLDDLSSWISDNLGINVDNGGDGVIGWLKGLF
jgi:hypothetical protein